MHIITTISEMQDIVSDARAERVDIGFVPTMGSLHGGHAELIKVSSMRHSLTVVSVFVNPLQFGPSEDFGTYPRNLDSDVRMIREHGGTHVFAPSAEEMYPQGFATSIHIGGIAKELEGAGRPGHFDGVATVVCKLFNTVMPTEAFFGQKDYQQTLVVKQMVADLAMPIAINVVPTVREADGLAMSSRNAYLNFEERNRATSLFRALTRAKEFIENLEAPLQKRKALPRLEIEALMQAALQEVSVEYAVAVDAATLQSRDNYFSGEKIALLIAAFAGRTRLIDNIVTEIV
ncbi:MAG: pantoate--beta-alanine ligase [Ignavibacteria bacterium]|nr:pantoate--beta-alanine ligase [Ignavibacteria bacterium]